MLKIGVTERGDAGRDFSWVDKCLAHKVDGCLAVAKSVTPELAAKVSMLRQSGFPIALHATVTGWGGSAVEPGVPRWRDALAVVRDLIAGGFPAELVTLRIDPIFPTEKGLRRVQAVIRQAMDWGILPAADIRISVLDEYMHVKDRFRACGWAPIYGPKDFYASPAQFKAVEDALAAFPGLVYKCCAEPRLTGPQFAREGCVSPALVEKLGLSLDPGTYLNPQHRSGCMCVSGKTELLSARHPCPNQCRYCYWKD